MDLSIIDQFIDDDDDDDDYNNDHYDYLNDYHDNHCNNNIQTIINDFQSQLSSDEQTNELKNIAKHDKQRQQYDYFMNRILILQKTCQNLAKSNNLLQTECDHYCRQFRTYQFLFTQEKLVRQRLSRLLTSNQRELEYHKRYCCQIKNVINNNNHHHHHHGGKNYRQHSLSLTKTRKKRQKIRTTLSTQSTNTNRNNNHLHIEHNQWKKCSQPFVSVKCKQQQQQNIDNDDDQDNGQKTLIIDTNQSANHVANVEKKSNLVLSDSMRKCINFSRSLIKLDDMNEDSNNVVMIENCNSINNDMKKNEQVKQLIMVKKTHEFHGIFFNMTIENGVIIRQVANNSEAYKAGLRQGDRILEICGINMRMANYKWAEKIINECEENEIPIKINSTTNRYETDMNLTMIKNSNNNRKLVTKRSTLIRRNAFKRKNRILHPYFDRKQNEQLALYQNHFLNVTLPRRIHLRPLFANKLKLCGGNAVGIFVHTIAEELKNFLQIGDQILEYNKYDLTQATAEDAALHLAEPIAQNIQTAELVVLFNIDVFQQIQDNPIGDSFYIRAEFSRSSCSSSLQFNKGDILYVDSTLYDGKPCKYWRAWKLDPFGQPIENGHIPSKYNAECEMFRRLFCSNNDDMKSFRSIRQLFQRLTSNKSYNENDTRLLASFSYMTNNNNVQDKQIDDHNSFECIDNLQAYRRVQMIEQTKPRPVIIFGPYSHTIGKRLEMQFSSLFQLCQKKTETMIMMASIKDFERKKDEHYISCAHREDGSGDFISLTNIMEIINQGKHPVITVTGNSLDEFHSQQIYPIIIELNFRTAKRMKIAVNKHWNHTSKISLRTAKNIHKHHRKLSKQFENIEHVILNADINLMAIIAMIKLHVLREQNKLIWTDASS
ncbi:Disks large 5 [Dermatophagoides farinae]|uniref:Disks large 5 n=1 Tax=Dermatophagoides farinae TaxID=6954 RepID=A0A922HZ54_DERFA|nr:Disks large 5 [Dermatophagoides farinae]